MALLDHKCAVGLVAGIEQHLAAVDVAGLRTDRQDSQGLPTQ